MLRLTHPERIVYPAVGLTKRDVMDYYVHVAPLMLPHLKGRPLSLVRCPEGMAGKCFYQKQPPAGLPDSVKRVTIETSEGPTEGVMVSRVEGLAALVQFGTLEVHAWQARSDQLEKPDQIVLDLDPGPDVPWAHVVEAALLTREALRRFDLQSFVKTTGGKGLHVTLPIARRRGWDDVKQFSRGISQLLVDAAPSRFTLSMAKKARPGKIFVDYLRNDRGSTAVAPYSTRARDEATVSMPLEWKQLERGVDPLEFTVTSVGQRAAKGLRDAWAPLRELRQSIRPAAFRAVAGHVE